MGRDILIGFVGKPSSGKSTMLNALTDATAKTGNFPFTTIEPNRAIGYAQVDCACSRFGLEGQCRPIYGGCKKGKRAIPIQLLDVAGLIPGAHTGKGLGNKFLDDLRHANALVHVVDVSGTTDSEGKACRGYDPSVDIEWLYNEMTAWIGTNLKEKWPNTRRRHIASKANPVHTLQNQFSGYGSNPATTARVLDSLHLNVPLESWDEATLDRIVSRFVDIKFPTVIALNKIDHPDADANISKIARREDPKRLVLASAVSEVFLRRLAKQGFVKYEEGSEFVDTIDEFPDSELKPLSESLRTKITDIQDMVLFRHGSTGVCNVLARAIELLELIPVYSVKNIHNFANNPNDGIFKDCVLVRQGTTAGQVAQIVLGGEAMSIIGINGNVGESDPIIAGKNDILSFRLRKDS
ncbi:Obg-like protein ATPase, OLA1-like protein [Schizosaccharomyces osmophilus]|uniref:Obg-like protein ATPase, OLA1-like protein n=1 Tax=Schizosaccharomyces osmophilus TaxID=2545709 RepID=A0AAF0AZS5_9SCHI|nr:Obg-like protein ATPase, OLA1-like protein [Schizosaccharomyces osmophilus]WBW75333.1 Obg-like protein ATPase, OLA1-like protein [Schizosaccharomyces osmophilus]